LRVKRAAKLFVPKVCSEICKRLSGESRMWKIAPLIGLTVATFFTFRVAMNLPHPLGGEPETLPKTSPASPRAPTTQGSHHTTEPAYKAVVRCLSDMDDLLDTVHDPASFAAVKPQLLSRARQHAAEASAYPNQGMTQLSRAASLEWQKAANRHTEALARAIQAAPAVRGFFEQDIATILSAK
jgi:hypothetical protein